MTTPTTNAQITRTLGVYVQPGIGTAYPELVAILRKLYADRVAQLPFVPSGWLADVLDLMGGNVVVLLQQSKPKGVPYAGLPAWIGGDAEAIDAWQQVALLVNSTYFNFAAGKVAEGRKVIATANANAAFWNALYKGAVFVRDAPGDAVAAIGKGTLGALGAFLGKTWWVLGLVVVGFLVWTLKGDIAKTVTRKVKAAVS